MFEILSPVEKLSSSASSAIIRNTEYCIEYYIHTSVVYIHTVYMYSSSGAKVRPTHPKITLYWYNIQTIDINV